MSLLKLIIPAGLIMTACSLDSVKTGCPANPSLTKRFPGVLEVLPNSPRTPELSLALSSVERCRPINPVLGTPTTLTLLQIKTSRQGGYYLEFSVKALADVTLVYHADKEGNLDQAYVY